MAAKVQKDFDKLVEKLREGASARMAKYAEGAAEEYVERFGSAADALLYLEWAEREAQIDHDDEEALEDLLQDILKRAENPDNIERTVRSFSFDTITG